nr:PREDICTED: uncharacterized protein LOC109032652 isoform X1 [Bemisia tabaci]
MSTGVHVALELLTLAFVVVGTPGLSDIVQLTAEPDFKSVTLRWEYARSVPILYGFQINYCEMQAWGPNRCRSKVVDKTRDEMQAGGSKRDHQLHTATVNGLRMSTNYTFEVRPLEEKKQTDSKIHSKRIVVPTKGFSAKASLCLPDVSEVEVSTGPHFGGRISVEPVGGKEDPSKEDLCAIKGEADSARDSYILRIDHKLCGSKVNRTTVQTFILVQENLPILTHSTRRFLVLCTFQPETLTVRAGINLPHHHGNYHHREPPSNFGSYHLNDVNGNELSGNDVHAAALQQSLDPQSARHYNPEESEARIVLMLMLVMMSSAGLGLVVWWFFPKLKPASRFQPSSSSISSDDTVSCFDNDAYFLRERDDLSIAESNFAAALEDDNPGPAPPPPPPPIAGGHPRHHALRQGVCNEVLIHQILTSPRPATLNQTKISIGEPSQSEA